MSTYSDDEDEMLRDLLLEMEGEGKLLPFLENHGDLMVMLGDALHNEVRRRIAQAKEDASDELRFAYEQASGNDVVDGSIFDDAGKFIAKYSDELAQMYLEESVLPGPGQRSISDDDLCSGCLHCAYNPGQGSGCGLGWPTPNGPSEYVVTCTSFAATAPATAAPVAPDSVRVSDLIDYLSQIRDDDGDGASISIEELHSYFSEYES